MAETINFNIMRIYHCENRTLTTEGRAVLNTREREPGTPVKFNMDGKDYYGDVVENIKTQENSELHNFLKKLAERNVIVHLFPDNNR